MKYLYYDNNSRNKSSTIAGRCWIKEVGYMAISLMLLLVLLICLGLALVGQLHWQWVLAAALVNIIWFSPPKNKINCLLKLLVKACLGKQATNDLIKRAEEDQDV